MARYSLLICLISWTGGTTDSIEEHFEESARSKSLIVSLAASLVVRAGCANPPRSVERPYSDAEIKSYA
ncbi:hypothetical protein ACPTIH_32380, partial [Pseudomonas aeruginosa]